MKDNKEQTTENNPPLPVLRGGELLVNRKGNAFQVHRVRHPKRDTGYDEDLYRLSRLKLIGNREWTLEELNAAGLKLME